MILTCGKCNKRYLIKEEQIGPKGREVRCSACEHVWKQKPAESVARFAAIDTVPVAAGDVNISNPSTFLSTLNWMTYPLFCVLLFAGLIVAREPISQLLPITTTFYKKIGFNVYPPSKVLAIKTNQPIYFNSNGETLILVNGKILNNSQEVQTLPSLTISVQGNCAHSSWLQNLLSKLPFRSNSTTNQCTLKEWKHYFVENRLLPGEQLAFETAPYPLLLGAKSIVVKF